MEKLLSTKEIAQKWGISSRRIAILCSEGRIAGVQRVGASWGKLGHTGERQKAGGCQN